MSKATATTVKNELFVLGQKSDWLANFDSYLASVLTDDLAEAICFDNAGDVEAIYNVACVARDAITHARFFVRDIAYNNEMLCTLLCVYANAIDAEIANTFKALYDEFIARQV